MNFNEIERKLWRRAQRELTLRIGATGLKAPAKYTVRGDGSLLSLDRYWIPVVFFSEDRKLHVTNEIVRYSSKPVSVEELATLEKVLEEWLDWLEVGAGGDLSE